MSTLEIAFLIGILSAFATVIAAGTAFAFSINNRISAVSERVGRLESTLEAWLDKMGLAAAKMLHRDDDKFQVDFYLDIYRNRHHEMSMDQWIQFRVLMDETANNPKASKQEQVMAQFLAELAAHKLQMFQDKTK
jgi:hypothetical protein